MVARAENRSGEPGDEDAFLNALPLPCCWFNSCLELSRASISAGELFGTGASELLGKTPDLWQAINIGDKKAFNGLLLDLLHGRVAHAARQFTHKLPSRVIVLCEWHFSVHQTPGQTTRHVIALIRPLNTSQNTTGSVSIPASGELKGVNRLEQELFRKTTELQQTNLILSEKDKRLSVLLKSLPVGICVADLNGKFTGEMNPAYFNLLGYDTDELQQMTPGSITHPDDLSFNQALVDDVSTGRLAVANYEKRFLKKNGEVVWVHVTLSPLVAEDDGRIYNLIAVVQDITAHKQTEHALRQNEELTRIGGKMGKIGGWMRNPGGNSALYWSDQVYEIYEYEGATPLSIEHVYNNIIKPEFRDLCKNEFTRLTIEGQHVDYECAITTCKGSDKWIRVVGEAQLDANGNINRINGAIQDITDYKNQQVTNQQLSLRLSSTLDSMQEAFLLIDRNWCVYYMNHAAENLLKLKLEQVQGVPVWESQPQLKNTPLYATYYKAMTTGETLECEYYSTRLENWIVAHVHPSTEGIAVYLHSISEHKKLAAQVAESEEKLKYVARATLDLVWERDLIANTIQWDSGLKKLGYASNAEDGRSVTDDTFWLKRIHPEEKDSVISRLDTVLKSNLDHWEATYRFEKRDGSHIHVMDRGVILRDRELRPIKMIGGMADISERVKLEEHLQQNQRIESIGKLTGGLAHDFNNLLTVMLGNAELLGSCASDALQKKLAGNIVSSALKGADLTRRLLAFARRQSLEPAAVNVNKLVQGMEGLLMRALGENIDVVIKTSANLNTALADRNQLESALLNLCINARDAMPGGGQIRIETFDITLMANAPGIMERVIPGDYVAIKVIDTGTGIEAELLPHVFEPFFTTKELGKGTGLGLSTVFGFIRQSNGHVTITSTPGSGTAVVLYLPITQHQEKAADANNPESYALGNETILLVEDDANVRNFSSHFLQSLGYQVIVAENGATALDILIGRNDINLLFTDIIMAGGIDGSELARRALALRPALKVLYTSGYTDNALLKEGMLDSSENFLAKPYTLAKMALRIRDSLDKHNDG
jgi:PAS domain S-box-containing protein